VYVLFEPEPPDETIGSGRLKEPYLTSGLSTAPVHRKLEAFLQIDVETQRRIATLIVMFGMVEQGAEFALLHLKGEPLVPDRIPSTDGLTALERFREIRLCADRRADASVEMLRLIADIGTDLTVVRHTVVYGVPRGNANLDRNGSWFGEGRKRQHARVGLTHALLDTAADVADVLFKALCGFPLATDDERMRSLASMHSDGLDDARRAMAVLRADTEAC
jgi:hypothetical protein